MDADRFDALTRSLGSRRGVLGTLFGGLLGIVTAARSKARGRCQAPGKPCAPGGRGGPGGIRRRCCEGACLRNGTCPCKSADHCPQSKSRCKRAACIRTHGCRIVRKRTGSICYPARCRGSNRSLPAKTCTRRGTCTGGPIVSCGMFGCNPATGTCFSSCTSSAECAGTTQCIDGACQQPPPPGPQLVSVDVPPTVNVSLSVQGTVTLDKAAQSDTTITINVANNRALVEDSIVPDGQTTGTFQITGVTPGPETVSATLGATTVTDTIEVTNIPV